MKKLTKQEIEQARAVISAYHKEERKIIMKKEFYLVADFAGTKEEVVAFCEAHPEFQIVDLPNAPEEFAEFLAIGIKCETFDDRGRAYDLFAKLGWDRGSVWQLSLEFKDED